MLATCEIEPGATSAPEATGDYRPDGGPSAPPSTRTGYHILYVDDDPICHDALTLWLRSEGFQVTQAACPTEAELRLADGSFDVLLSDVCMPGNCELEWIERVVQRTDLPTVLITASPALTTAMRAANLPIAGYHSKPCELPELAGLLRTLGGRRRRGRELRALAHEIVHATAAETNHPFGARLARLAQTFAQESTRLEGRPNPHLPDARLHQAIQETVEVLQKTRHHFRSKDLGSLRRRLEALLSDL